MQNTNKKRLFLNVGLTGEDGRMLDTLCVAEGRNRSSMTRKLIRDAYHGLKSMPPVGADTGDSPQPVEHFRHT